MNSTKTYEIITQALQQYGTEYSILDISELDGLLAACACKPDIATVSQWLPALWGGEQHSPEWQAENEISDFIGAAMEIQSVIMNAIFNETYQPLFSEGSLEGKANTIADEWCYGFLRAMEIWGPLSQIDEEFMTDALKPIQLFASEEGLTELENMSEEEINLQIQQVKRNIIIIHRHFLQARFAE